MESIVEEKCEVKVLALSNTQTITADKNKGTKEPDATNIEKKVKFISCIFFNFTIHMLYAFKFLYFILFVYFFSK